MKVWSTAPPRPFCKGNPGMSYVFRSQWTSCQVTGKQAVKFLRNSNLQIFRLYLTRMKFESPVLSSVVCVCTSTPMIHTSLIPYIFDLLAVSFSSGDAKEEKCSFSLPVTTFATYSFPPIPNPHNFLLPPPSCHHSLLCHLLIPSREGYDECGISAKAALQGPLQQTRSEQLIQHKQGWLRFVLRGR